MKKLFGLAVLLCGMVWGETFIHKVGVKEGVSYLEAGREEKLDLYYPADRQEGETFPGVVIIHGGGWTSGVKDAEREINIGCNLARMGYVCVSIDYRLATRANLQKYGKIFPVNIQDCKKAVQWLRVHKDELHLNAAKIGCIGGSAGGHLSALLAVAGADVGLEPTEPYPGVDSSIQAGVNLYGIMDFFQWRETEADGTPKEGRYRLGAQRAVMGSLETADRETWLKMSPLHQVDKTDPPILQLHGRADTTVDYTQAINMKAALDKAGVPNEMMLLDGVGHTFTLQKWNGKPLPKEVRQKVLAFYDKWLRGCSDAEAAERFAALEAFEQAHPEAAVYSGYQGRGGVVKALDGAKLTVEAQGKEQTFRLSTDWQVEGDRKLAADALRDGRRVEVQGKTLPDKEFDCRWIVYRNDQSDAVGKVSGRGVLRRKGDVWVLDAGRRVGTYTLKFPEKGPEVYERVRLQRQDVKVGSRLTWLRGRNYGDECCVSVMVMQAE